MNQEEQPRQNISMAVDAYGAITFWGFSPTTALNNLQKDESPNSMYNFSIYNNIAISGSQGRISDMH